MRKAPLFLLAAACCGFCATASAQTTKQNSQGNCSPNIASSHNTTINCNNAAPQSASIPPLPAVLTEPSHGCGDKGYTPFAKIMNEAIVESYRNCEVNTIAIYVGAGTGSHQIGEVALNNTIIRVVAP